MKQGEMVNYSVDTDKWKNNISCVKNVRKPCKIEERIRMRRLNNIENDNSDSRGVKSEPKNAIRKNSSGSSSPDTLNSCSSNSSEYLPRVRGSKERVDLLEIGIIGYEDPRARMKRTKSRLKSGQKVCRRIRPRSAPSSSRFFGSECVERDSFCCSGGTEEASDFVDCKIVERECIAPDPRKDIPEDYEPLGNPALISLMKESIDKLQAAGIKAKKSIQDIVNDNFADERSVNEEISGENGSAISETPIHEEEEEKKENQSLNFGESAAKVLPSSVGSGVAKDIGKCRRYETDLSVSAVVKDPENIYEPRQRCGCRPRDSMRKSNTVFKYAESFNGSVGWTPRSREFAETNGTRNSPKKFNGSIVRSCCCTRSGDPLESRCRFETRDRRSSSSPRRKVTFRLPSLVIPEEEDEEEEEGNDDDEDEEERTKRKSSTPAKIFGSLRNKDKKFDEEGEEDAARKSDTMTLISTCCCCNIHRAQFRRNRRHHRCWRCLNRFEKSENDNRKSFSPKVVNFCKEIITKRQDIVGEDLHKSDSKTSVTSEKDWTVDNADDNLDYSGLRNSVYFPKETRRAMNVLLQNRDNRPNKESPTSTRITLEESQHGRKTQRNDRQHQKQQQRFFREANVLKKPDLEIFNIEEGKNKAMHVATYAQALAVFQKRCDPLAGGSCKKKRHVAWKEGDGARGSTAKDKRRARDTKYLNFIRNQRYTESEIRTFCGAGRNTGFDMQNNGSDNGSSENGIDRTGWTVGLINGRFKYLTAETFGFKINANGASLKKKQLWTLEGSEHQVFLRSHLDRYLAVDQFGNVTCEAEDTADPGCAFQIQVASDGSGRWALKNIQRGYFLGSSQDELKCTAKVPGDAEYWLVHLAARPQVNLRSAGRKRFAHLSAAQDEIHVDAPVPWGEDTLFTLEFRPAAMPDADSNGDARREVRSEAGIGGHYALHTCNNKYLARDGKLLDSCTRDCLYAAEFHAGMLALRDVSGAYLAPIGSKAVLKSRSNTVTRDELFSLEDSLPQASFVAALNQRYVSVKQGVDVTANQDEISGHETFQLEFDRATKRWYLRTMQDRYWTLEAGGGIQASDHKRSSNALFDLVWQPVDGTVALRANNGKFLATKRSGHLYANADSPGESEASKFYFYLMNRPVLVLRCEQGFVGLKSNASPKLECNKASYETIRVERCDRGIVRFKGQNGKYWHADSEGVTSDADVPSDGFYLELREPSRICIKSTDGRYLSAGKNGVFRLGDTEYESATKWEF